MIGKDMVKQEPATVQVATEQNRRTLRPAVDIFETENALILTADLPGVSREGLQVQVENGVLTLRGESGNGLPGQVRWREFSPALYQRSFQLPEEIDTGAIAAALEQGVLTLTLPKAPSAQPRRIEIKTVH